VDGILKVSCCASPLAAVDRLVSHRLGLASATVEKSNRQVTLA